jgi:uncharacterized protein YndB with AHSA1/START domain
MGYRIESSVSIKATPEQVWSVIQDPARRLEWDARITANEVLTPGAIGKGTRSRVTYSFFGMPSAIELEMVSWQPPRRSGVKGVFVGTADTIAGSWNFEPDGTGATVFTTRLVLSSAGPFGRLRELIFGSMTARLTKISQANLKRLVESDAALASLAPLG